MTNTAKKTAATRTQLRKERYEKDKCKGKKPTDKSMKVEASPNSNAIVIIPKPPRPAGYKTKRRKQGSK